MAKRIVAGFIWFVKLGRPWRCPYCESTDIDVQRGWAECRDCGKTWSW